MPLAMDSFFKSIHKIVDIGGGSGYMSIEILKKQVHLLSTNADLHQCEAVMAKYLEGQDQSLKDRMSFQALDFFKDDFPKSHDAIMFGHVIHDWEDSTKKMLIKKAYNALEVGKYIILYEFLLDEKEPKNTLDNYFMSIHMQTACKGS